MLEILGSLFSSILAGGATGILGVVVQRFADYKNRQIDVQAQATKDAHELAMRDKDAAIMAQEWAARTKVAEVEAAATVDAADAAAFSASFKVEPTQYSAGAKLTTGQGWLLVLLDFLRGIVRPGLTIYLCAITTWVYLDAHAALNAAALSASEALGLVKMVTGTVLYLTTTCVLWWFGTRNRQVPPKVPV